LRQSDQTGIDRTPVPVPPGSAQTHLAAFGPNVRQQHDPLFVGPWLAPLTAHRYLNIR